MGPFIGERTPNPRPSRMGPNAARWENNAPHQAHTYQPITLLEVLSSAGFRARPRFIALRKIRSRFTRRRDILRAGFLQYFLCAADPIGVVAEHRK